MIWGSKSGLWSWGCCLAPAGVCRHTLSRARAHTYTHNKTTKKKALVLSLHRPLVRRLIFNSQAWLFLNMQNMSVEGRNINVIFRNGARLHRYTTRRGRLCTRTHIQLKEGEIHTHTPRRGSQLDAKGFGFLPSYLPEEDILDLGLFFLLIIHK